MKKELIILLLVINIYANSDTNTTTKNYIDNPIQALLDASAYLDSLNSQDNKEKAVKVYEESKGKVKIGIAKGLAEVYCSDRYRDEIQCKYWSEKADLK